MRLTIVAVTAVLLAGCFCKSREEKLKDAEDEGNLLVATKAKLLKGAGEAVKKEGKEAAETIAEGTGEVFKGLGKGIEKGLMEVKIKPHESVAANGLGLTRAARGEEGTAKHTITAYVTFEKAFAGSLELRAYDSEDREVGRSKLDSDEKESGAKYLDFTFDERTPLMTAGHFELRATPKQP
ncbi:MAG: hypothetical protein Q8L48_29500 [Archangium sp.]|nr:hypothetical protein [Archangium sp.]